METGCTFISMETGQLASEKKNNQKGCIRWPKRKDGVAWRWDTCSAHIRLFHPHTPDHSIHKTQNSNTHTLTPFKITTIYRGWKNGSAVKSACCLESAPIRWLTTTCNSSFKGSDVPSSECHGHYIHVPTCTNPYTDTYRHAHIHIKMKSIKNIKGM